MTGRDDEFPNLDLRHEGQQGVAVDRVIVLIGSVLIALGCFAPLVTFPIIGSVTFFGNGHGDGVFALGFAVIASVLALLSRTKWSAIVGLLELALLIFTFLNLQQAIGDAGASAEAELEGNPFKGLAGAMVRTISFSWGWVPLFVGAAMTALCRPLARLVRPGASR